MQEKQFYCQPFLGVSYLSHGFKVWNKSQKQMNITRAGYWLGKAKGN